MFDDAELIAQPLRVLRDKPRESLQRAPLRSLHGVRQPPAGFGLTAFALMLVVKAYGAFATISIEHVEEAEPRQAEPEPVRLAPAARQKREAA